MCVCIYVVFSDVGYSLKFCLYYPTSYSFILLFFYFIHRAGLLNQSIALKIQNYMKQEVDFVPWRAFLRESTYLKLMLRRTDIYGKYEVFLLTKNMWYFYWPKV